MMKRRGLHMVRTSAPNTSSGENEHNTVCANNRAGIKRNTVVVHCLIFKTLNLANDHGNYRKNDEIISYCPYAYAKLDWANSQAGRDRVWHCIIWSNSSKSPLRMRSCLATTRWMAERYIQLSFSAGGSPLVC